MQTDWSVACGKDDPVIVAPWHKADGSLHFVDLRNGPDSILKIPEAAQYSCIAAALQRWNQPDSAIFSAKCDVWAYPAKLFDAEDLEDFAFAQGSYIDLLYRDPAKFSNFSTCEQQVRRWSEAARSIELPQSRCEWTLRPAHILQSLMDASGTFQNIGPSDVYQDGFATTLYVWGYGASSETAAAAWSNAIPALIEPVLLFARP